MKALKSKRIFILIWVVIALSALSSLKTLVLSWIVEHNQLFLWLTAVRFITTATLLLMSLRLWRMVKGYTLKTEWDSQNYKRLMQMGYLAIVLTILNASFQLGYEVRWLQLTHSPMPQYQFYWVQRFIGIVFMESPVLWVFTLSIFLFAELLNSAHQVKAENEAFI